MTGGKVLLSNDGTSYTESAFAASKSWTLASGADGPRTVSAKFKDAAGNVTATAVTASIILDTAGPTGVSLKINGGAFYTRTTAVTLALSGSDPSGVKEMRLNNGSLGGTWEPFAVAKSWTLSSGDGVKTVYAQLRDNLGNVSAGASATITLDGTPPQDGTLQATPGNQQVTLTWSGFSDAQSGIQSYQLYYSPTGYPTAATGTKIYEGAALTFTHQGLIGSKICYYRLCAVDKAGNVSTGATAKATSKAQLPFIDLLLLNYLRAN